MFIWQVIPFTECAMGLEPQDFTETKLTAKKFTEQACETGVYTLGCSDLVLFFDFTIWGPFMI